MVKIRIVDYMVAADYEKAKLERLVNELMKQGYMPYGGVSVSFATNANTSPKSVILYAQAMVKYE
jgi:hypothetical protein